MKRCLFLVSLIFTLSLIASAQTIKLKVKRINLGASYHSIISQFGKPLSSRKGGTNACGNTKLTLRYPGLIFTLDDDVNDRNFIVIAIEVTSPKWMVASGINIGTGLQTVQAKFVKTEPINEKNLEKLSYFVSDGYANFYFQNKKLIKVIWEMNLC